MKQEYDIAVIGAGTAGCVAAIQAARAGARTILIEKNAAPGGTMTVGGVDFPGLFHAWGKQVIAGIGWEIIEKCVAEAGGEMPDFSDYKQRHWKLQVRINPFLCECLIDEEFTKSGVEVLYHTMPVSVSENSEGVRLILCGKQGEFEIHAKNVIDTTGDANVAAMAGYELIRNKIKQPATPMLQVSGYEISELDLEHIDKEFHKAVEAGEMLHTDPGTSGRMSGFLHTHGSNSVHVTIDDACGSQDKSTVEMKARATVLRIYRFLKQFSGLEKLKIDWMAPECGIRETATIKGEYSITLQDYVSGAVFDDSLCHAYYPVDLHLNTADGLDCRPLQEGVVPTVPLRALIPAGSSHILVAGRCVSSDQLANSGLRVQAACMAMAQAAACAAVIAGKNNCNIADVNILEVKSLLKEHKAIVP